MIGLLLLLACRDPGEDRRVYLDAASVAVDDAPARCRDIREPGLRGECLSMVAGRAAKTLGYDRAAAMCATVRDPLWREECYFLAADDARLVGDDAVRACGLTGRYRENCLGHAIGREAEAIEKAHGAVGQEPILVRKLEELVARYKPAAPEDQRRATSDTLAARTIAGRWGDGPFDEALCGAAPRELCSRAYRSSLDATPREVGIERLCRAPINRERVEAIRARAWVDASEALALETWARFCSDLEAGVTSFDPNRQMGVGPRSSPQGFPGGPPPPP